MKVIIMAGGRGTRISELFPNIPKPLIPIDGVPVLEREICSLRDQGFKDIILTVGYLANEIINYFGDGSRFGVNIDYYVEKKPLGNAGALFELGLDDDFLLLNADAVFDVDFNRFVEYHKTKGGLVTLFTHPNSHPYDSGLIIADELSCVEKWLTKEDERPNHYKNRVNAGLHVVNPQVFTLSGINPDDIGKNVKGKSIKIDLDRQILKHLCGTGKMFCYDSPEYVKDMGTPERFQEVNEDYLNGIISSKNLKNKQRAIFLDRDGTINKYIGFLRTEAEFELLPDVACAIKEINKLGYLAIVVTNQPVIARGEVSYAELDSIHNKMETLLGMEGAFVDAIYYCPHHPDKGFEGEIPELKINCNCRKPKPGMILDAEKNYNIDLSASYMIGDSDIDVELGHNARLKGSYKIQTNNPDQMNKIVDSYDVFITIEQPKLIRNIRV